MAGQENAAYFSNSLQTDHIVDLLECGKINFPNVVSVDFVQTKISELSSLLSGTGYLSILNASKAQKKNLVFLFRNLKTTIQNILDAPEKGRQTFKYRCCTCCDKLRGRLTWNNIQDHDHLEEEFCKIINNIHKRFDSDSEDLSLSIINDSSEGYENVKRSNQEDKKKKVHNFPEQTTETVLSTLYPPSYMTSIRKFDESSDYTIMIAGPSKPVCLVCFSEMRMRKIFKKELLNHAVGQRHLTATSTQSILEMLRFFHEFWSAQTSPSIQAHQIYFRLSYIPDLECALCYEVVPDKNVVSHIVSSHKHKQKVLKLYSTDKTLYHLLPLQVSIYGVVDEKPEPVFKKRRSKPEKKPKTEKKNPENEKPVKIHEILPSVENKESSNVLDLLPRRMKVHLPYFFLHNTPRGSFIQCTMCKNNMLADLAVVKTHIIQSPNHAAISEKYRYYCEICNHWEKNENMWLRHNFRGPRHNNMAESRKKKVTEYDCITCKCVIFGDNLSLLRHAPKDKEKTQRGNKLPEKVSNVFKSASSVQEEADMLVKSAMEVTQSSTTQICIDDLKNVLLEAFPDCKIYPFGSTVSGIGDKESDTDLYVDVGSMYSGECNQTPKDQVLLIRKVAKVLSKHKKFQRLVQVLTARTPILKLFYVPLEIECDLSFINGLSMENTKFVQYCLQLQPICQPFFMMVKRWASYIDLENFTTYALTTMCIFYLQMNGFLLSVEQLRDIHGRSGIKVIAGWKTIDYTKGIDEVKKNIKICNISLHQLLKNFFAYYEKFNFETYIACPLLAQLVKKTVFNNPEKDLPPEMEDYVNQLGTDDTEFFKIAAVICVQDPFDLSHNLTKAVVENNLKHFRAVCKLSVAQLTTIEDD